MTTLSDILEKFGLKKSAPAPAAAKQKPTGPAASNPPAAHPAPAVPHPKTPGHAPTTPPPAASPAAAKPAQAAPVRHDAEQKQKSAGTGQPKQAHTPPPAASQAEARSVAPSAPQTSAPPPPPPVKAEPVATPAASVEPAATPAAPAVEPEPEAISVVDVVSDLENRAARHPEKLNWKVSIVDLLKLLGLESSFDARKGLAVELGCPADLMSDSAKMNTWLHKAVLSRIAENGGNIPKELLD